MDMDKICHPYVQEGSLAYNNISYTIFMVMLTIERSWFYLNCLAIISII